MNHKTTNQTLTPIKLQLITNNKNNLNSSKKNNITIPFKSIQKIINIKNTNKNYIQNIKYQIHINNNSTNKN